MDKPHKKLEAWKKSIELAGEIYRLAAGLPVDERFGLISQMRRSAVSIPSNIAEGAARNSDAEFRHFVSIARSSLSELDTQIDICRLLGYLDQQSHDRLNPMMDRIDKILYGLHRSLEKSFS